MKNLLPGLGVLGLMFAAYLLGSQRSQLDARSEEAPGSLGAQVSPELPVPAAESPRGQDPVSVPSSQASPDEMLVYDSNDGPGTAANGIIAVTGSYGVGTSVLYVIDAKNLQLAVYEARGGAESMRRLVHVGSRRIDLDLQLEGFNDQSMHSYQDLKRLFGTRPDAKGSSPGGQRNQRRR
ncbi:MAG: hypothetical protein ACYTG5_08295 [Planctomycetota bacterium]|jgi:hypothetical protein